MLLTIFCRGFYPLSLNFYTSLKIWLISSNRIWKSITELCNRLIVFFLAVNDSFRGGGEEQILSYGYETCRPFIITITITNCKQGQGGQYVRHVNLWMNALPTNQPTIQTTDTTPSWCALAHAKTRIADKQDITQSIYFIVLCNIQNCVIAVQKYCYYR